jgi:hypothetical protein
MDGELGQEDHMSFDPGCEPAMTVTWNAALAPRAAGTTPTGLVRHGPASRTRGILEDFVRREFFEHFGARIREFMPELLALHRNDDAIRAVVGCRAAANVPLFLEQYTREPIETVLAERTGEIVQRERIVEIGSLACRNAAAAIAIIRALVPHLTNEGFTWVVFTGADTVMNVFRHIGLAPRPLCPANPLLLGDARHDWGTYYDHDPHVMAGRICDGALASYPFASRRSQ